MFSVHFCKSFARSRGFPDFFLLFSALANASNMNESPPKCNSENLFKEFIQRIYSKDLYKKYIQWIY